MGNHLVNGMPQNPVVGDIYFDISDGKIKVPGQSGIHVFGGSGSGSSVQFGWYGDVSSDGTATKRGGSLSLRVSRVSDGRYMVSGISTEAVVTVTPQYRISGVIQAQTAHSAVILRSSSGSATVLMYDAEGVLSDHGFSMMVL